jgi:hypothetical protein
MARRSINQLITEIDTTLEVGLPWDNNVFHGIAVLQPRDDGNGSRTWPMARLDSNQQGQRISPVDTQALQFYHRIIGQTNEAFPGKGAKMYNDVVYTVRLVAVGYRPQVSARDWWDNEQVAEDIIRVMASTSRLDQGELYFVEGPAVTDKLTVFNEEYQNNEDIKRWILDLIGVAITYTIKQRTVGNDC